MYLTLGAICFTITLKVVNRLISIFFEVKNKFALQYYTAALDRITASFLLERFAGWFQIKALLQMKNYILLFEIPC